MTMNENENHMMTHVADAPFDAYKGSEPYIFISYSHKDAELVFPELIRFREQGFNVWYDQGIGVGEEWALSVEESLMNCALFVIFISENSVESVNVRNEINMALNENIPFVAIYLEDAELKYGLKLRIGSIQGILKYSMHENDYISNYLNAFKRNGINIISKPKESYVYVSYDEKDETSVLNELKRFKSQNLNVKTCDLTCEITKKTVEDIQNCSLFIVFISPNSVNSTRVRDEIFYALSENIPFIAIHLEPTNITGVIKLKLESKPSLLKYEIAKQEYIESCSEIFKNYGFKIIEPELSQLNFNDLDNLIHNGEKLINIESDFKLDNTKDTDYKEGININIDDLVIDGNNKTIDASEFSRIFKITGKNITIKNLKLINGHSVNPNGKKHENGGGAIYIEENASLNLVKCHFLHNYSESDGGAVYNKGELTSVKQCKFENNACRTSGGALANFKLANIIKTNFKSNESLNGGTIYNFYDSKLKLRNCKLKENKSLKFAGGIYNYGNMKIEECTFRSNSSDAVGGAILNYGSGEILTTTFRDNTSTFGGAIFNMTLKKLMTYSFDSYISENEEGSIKFIECNFTSNTANKLGGAICNLSKCRLEECDFGNNLAKDKSHIISNGSEGIFASSSDLALTKQYLASIDISYSTIKIKPEIYDNAIYNQQNCLLKVSNDTTINQKHPSPASRIFLNNGEIDFYDEGL